MMYREHNEVFSLCVCTVYFNYSCTCHCNSDDDHNNDDNTANNDGQYDGYKDIDEGDIRDATDGYLCVAISLISFPCLL